MPTKKKGVKKKAIAKPERAPIIRAKLSEAQINAIITDAALKPNGITYDDIAKKWNIGRRTLYELRAERQDEILSIQNDFFSEHKADVMKALVDSAKGFFAEKPEGLVQYPPNAKSIEIFFQIHDRVSATEDADTFRLFDIFWPLPKQAQFIFGGDPTGSLFINLLVSGIGYGKTRSLIHKAVTLARRNRKRNGMLISPTYKMLQNPVMSYFLEMLEEVNSKNRYNKNNGELTLWGDTTILLRSCDNYENLRGPNVAWVAGDELRNWDYEAFKILLGRIRDPQSSVREFAGVTTPWGFNWVYDLVEKGDGTLGARVNIIRAKTEENIFLPLDFIELVRDTYDEEYAKQELDGVFLNIGTGRIFSNFDRLVHVRDNIVYNPSLPVYIGQDFNVNPMATVLCQPVRNGTLTEIHVFDEIAIKSANVQDTIKELCSRGYDPKHFHNELVVYPDATGWANNPAASMSTIKQFQDVGFTIKAPKANGLVRDRYAAVNGKLKNANGIASLFVSSKCRNLITDLEREVYKEGASHREDVKDGAKLRGHHSDALGYVIHREFAIETGYRPARPV